MLFCGIDASDRALDYHLRTADGQVLAEGRVRPVLEELIDLFTKLEAHAPPEQIAVALESAHGAWVQSLLDRGYRIYPVNPKTADHFRKALSAAGNKSDRIDARVLATFLASCYANLHPLRPDDPEIVMLRIACQDRVRLVEERTGKLNELQALLKGFYPAFLGLFGDLHSRITLTFLQEFPTQKQMRALTPRKLTAWVKRHSYSCMERIEEMRAHLVRPALPVAEHLQAAHAPRIRYLAGSILALHAEITQRERDILERFDKLPEADWIRSLPAVGPALGPALLACIGRDPQRFATTADAQAFLGTAPVTWASGAARTVRFRIACWKFGRRTLQLFAEASRHACDWAQAYYKLQRERGKAHPAAVRALANKWLKIILALKRSGQPYNEAVFLDSRARRLLPRTPMTTLNSKSAHLRLT
jgi:transposase